MTQHRGFSLIEMLMVLAISLVVGSAVVMMLMSQIQITSTQNRNMVNQQDLRDTVNFVIDEIQAMGSGQNMVQAYLLNAEPADVDYVGDLDGDNVMDRVRFYLDGASLNRTLYSTADDGATWTEVRTDLLLPDVAALEFVYYAYGNELMAQPIETVHTINPTNDDVDEVTSVEFQLTLDTTQAATVFTSGRISQQRMIGRTTVRNRLFQ